ncbi:MAG: ATP-binding cassette domain-containing protein [Granulosicoccus sp.]
MSALTPVTHARQLIHTHALNLSIGDNSILQNVDFTISSGEIVTIVGPNGSGKSTMLRLLIGALIPSSGTLVRASGLQIGYVPQRLDLERTLPITVRRFFDLPLKVSDHQVQEVCQQVAVAHLLNRQMTELSGGQLQRVLLARAVLNKPDILVLDEATQGLDQQGSAEFYRQIEALRNELGCAVLMVSHELHVVMSASDRVICLNGHVCCEGAPDVVSSQPEYRALFGTGTQGTLALYRHVHDHSHGNMDDHDHDHDHDHERRAPPP